MIKKNDLTTFSALYNHANQVAALGKSSITGADVIYPLTFAIQDEKGLSILNELFMQQYIDWNFCAFSDPTMLDEENLDGFDAIPFGRAFMEGRVFKYMLETLDLDYQSWHIQENGWSVTFTKEKRSNKVDIDLKMNKPVDVHDLIVYSSFLVMFTMNMVQMMNNKLDLEFHRDLGKFRFDGDITVDSLRNLPTIRSMFSSKKNMYHMSGDGLVVDENFDFVNQNEGYQQLVEVLKKADMALV